MRRTFLTMCAAGVLAGSAVPPAGAQYTDYRQAAGDQYAQQSVRARACVSQRRFVVTLRGPHGRPAVHVRVTLNGHRLRVVRRHGKLVVVVDLRGRRAGPVNLRISGVEYSAHRYARAKRVYARSPSRSAPRAQTAPQQQTSTPQRRPSSRSRKKSKRGGPFRVTRRFRVCAKASTRTVVMSGRPASATASPGGGLGGGGVLAVLGISVLGAVALGAAGRRVGSRRRRA